MAGKKWSNQELQFLRDNYQILSHKQIALKLNRTESSIQLKCSKLKLKSNNIRPAIQTKFGRLTINKYITKDDVQCICDCGKEKNTKFVYLVHKYVTSCGCAKIGSKGHGLKQHPIYSIWLRMKSKCYNPKYHRYEKDIEVCTEWKKDFLCFYNWAKLLWNQNLKLERKDLTKGFFPDNCIFLNSSDARKKYENRAILTNQQKFGVDYAPQLKCIQQKAIQTKINLYGTASPKSTRKEENEVKNYLSDLGLKFVSIVLEGKEIDLYNKKLNLGIEYCGLYWHHENSLSPRTKLYHYNKYVSAIKNNIQLITLFSDEWKLRNNQVKSRLKSLCNIYNQKIFARECSIQKIDNNIGQNFINNNHIQEQKRRGIYYCGLYYNNILVGVLSINKHHRDNTKYVLDRMCFKLETQIIGGANKLLKLAKSWCLDNKIKSILTWSDNRWSSGDIYKIMGFNFCKDIGPDYTYVKINNPKFRISKQSMKKQNTNCPSDKTEKQWCLENGLSRIWDCGKKRFELIL